MAGVPRETSALHRPPAVLRYDRPCRLAAAGQRDERPRHGHRQNRQESESAARPREAHNETDNPAIGRAGSPRRGGRHRAGRVRQADPTIDANKVIHLTWNDAIPGGIDGTNKGGQGNTGPGQYCRTLIDTAETDLQGGQQQQPSQAQLLKFSQCMRANGIPDFPDPSNGGLSINRAGGGDLNPSNPVFQKASTLCAKMTGVPGFASGGSSPPGSIEFNGDGQGGAGG
jgi:hypothetical protein